PALWLAQNAMGGSWRGRDRSNRGRCLGRSDPESALGFLAHHHGWVNIDHNLFTERFAHIAFIVESEYGLDHLLVGCVQDHATVKLKEMNNGLYFRGLVLQGHV